MLTILLADQTRLEFTPDMVRHAGFLQKLAQQHEPIHTLTHALKSVWKVSKDRQEWVELLWSKREDSPLSELGDRGSHWYARGILIPDRDPGCTTAYLLNYVVDHYREIFQPPVIHIPNVTAHILRWIHSFLQRHQQVTSIQTEELQRGLSLCTVHKNMVQVIPEPFREEAREMLTHPMTMILQLTHAAYTMQLSMLQYLLVWVLAYRTRSVTTEEVHTLFQLHRTNALLQKVHQVGKEKPWLRHFPSPASDSSTAPTPIPPISHADGFNAGTTPDTS